MVFTLIIGCSSFFINSTLDAFSEPGLGLAVIGVIPLLLIGFAGYIVGVVLMLGVLSRIFLKGRVLKKDQPSIMFFAGLFFLVFGLVIDRLFSNFPPADFVKLSLFALGGIFLVTVFLRKFVHPAIHTEAEKIQGEKSTLFEWTVFLLCALGSVILVVMPYYLRSN